MPAYLYKLGRRYEVGLTDSHSRVARQFGHQDIESAVKGGYVRLRDFGHSVAVQGRSKELCWKYLRIYLTNRRLPAIVSLEWPGVYLSLSGDELINKL